jgi:hypothetical protein
MPPHLECDALPRFHKRRLAGAVLHAHHHAQVVGSGFLDIYPNWNAPARLREVSDFLGVGFCVANSGENLLMPMRKF